jgi:hypothetical protein
MPGGLRQGLIHSEISFLQISVGCEANHSSASPAVATYCFAASMAAQLHWKEMPGASLPRHPRAVCLLETKSRQVIGRTANRHTSAEFVDFLAQVVASRPPGREIHVIADNLAAHKTRSSSTSSRRVIPRSTFTLPPPILRG